MNADTLAALRQIVADYRAGDYSAHHAMGHVEQEIRAAAAALAEREGERECENPYHSRFDGPGVATLCPRCHGGWKHAPAALRTPEPAKRCASPNCRGDGWHRHESYGKRPCPFYPATPQPSAERERIAEIVYEFAPVKTPRWGFTEGEVIPFAELIERKRRPFLAAADRILAERERQ